MARTFTPIQDYGVIGDCRSAALVSRSGSIDWLCWPRFDSGTMFAAILDPELGGCWEMNVCDFESDSRSYIDGTNVLVTELRTRGGVCRITDCMPVDWPKQGREHSFEAKLSYEANPFAPDQEVLRKVECVEGAVQVEMLFAPRPDFANEKARFRHRGKLGIEFGFDFGECWLRSSEELRVEDVNVRSEFKLSAGEVAWFSLSYTNVNPAVLAPLGEHAQTRLDRTISWWREWLGRIKYKGQWRQAVERSALALKLMIYAPSGAVIAAPTTSLPEIVGGSLNWDYRFCWLRDASLTVRALAQLGFMDEAEAFTEWMLNTTSLTLPRLNVLYDVFGKKPKKERIQHHLSGYMNSRPVRVGNAAADQLQLDVYGEVIDGVAQLVHRGYELDSISQHALISVGKYVVENWNRADEGIWEPRTGRAHHTHSRLLCWTALDRLIDMAAAGKLKGVPYQEFSAARELIRRDIVHCAWNSELQSYASVLGGCRMDASLLLIPWYGFECADTLRMQRTYACVTKELRAADHLLYRYTADPPEGAFGICSFWEAEFLALGGDSLEAATQRFDALLSYANDLGLYAEEIDPTSGVPVGNFPQAFTHVGLINSAISIEERRCGEQQLPHRQAGKGEQPRERAA